MNVPGSRRTLTDVAVDITVQCVDDHGVLHDIDTILGFRCSDPYAVTMTFLTGEGDLTWTFARDLLALGINHPTGDGDVRVCPAIGTNGRAMTDIELTSPDGHLVLQARADEVSDFVARFYESVPAGAESSYVDIDQMLSQLLAG